MTVKSAIKTAYTAYPKMETADFVKLLYQSEFGCKHMANDEEKMLRQLENELASCEANEKEKPFEYIGGGHCRMNLKSAAVRCISAPTIVKMMMYTAEKARGTELGFKIKLNVLLSMCKNGDIDAEIDENELVKLTQSLPVAHSEDYRKSYEPHYRVVSEVFAEFFEVFCAVEAMYRTRKMFFAMAIDGMSASGKSSFAQVLCQIYDCNIFHTDDYFLPSERKTKARLAQAGGNVDYERIKTEIIDKLNAPFEYETAKFDCQTQKLGEYEAQEKKRLTLLEGVYSMHPVFGDVYDVKLFMETSPMTQERRIKKRSGEKLWKRFRDEWIPLENNYFNTYNIEHDCIHIYT